MQRKVDAIQSRCLRKMTEAEFKEIYTFFQNKQARQSSMGLGAGDTHTRLTQASLNSQFGKKMNSELVFAVEQLVFLESLMKQQSSGAHRRTPSSKSRSGNRGRSSSPSSSSGSFRPPTGTLSHRTESGSLRPKAADTGREEAKGGPDLDRLHISERRSLSSQSSNRSRTPKVNGTKRGSTPSSSRAPLSTPKGSLRSQTPKGGGSRSQTPKVSATPKVSSRKGKTGTSAGRTATPKKTNKTK